MGAPCRGIDEHRDQTEPEQREKRHIERDAHRAEDQHHIAATKSLGAEQVSQAPALTLEFCERDRPVDVHDRGSIRPIHRVGGEQLDDVHRAFAYSAYRRIVRASPLIRCETFPSCIKAWMARVKPSPVATAITRAKSWRPRPMPRQRGTTASVLTMMVLASRPVRAASRASGMAKRNPTGSR